MMEVNIADLTWAPFIYPGGGKNEETVKAYIEALRAGAKFPPIKIQRVFNYPADNDGKREAALILDGIHRWSAASGTEWLRSFLSKFFFKLPRVIFIDCPMADPAH